MNLWKSLDPRVRYISLVVIAIGAVIALAVAWWLGSPLFINRTVNESFPVAAPAMPKPAAAEADADAMQKSAAMAKDGAMVKEDATAKTASSAMQESEAAAADAAMAKTDMAPESDAPVAVSSGNFTDADSFHKGTGTATIFTLPDGKRVLRFEDFNVTNGPDLFVYLSGHPEPRSAGELHGQGDFDLGRLKGNVGSQNYELPADLDLSKFKSVVIYCKQFSVVFSTATLVAARG